jgi:methionine-gamma-lyase
MDTKDLKFNSKLVHGGGFHDSLGSVTVPIYQTSTFAFKDADEGAACFSGESDGFIYTRINNPTIGALEKQIAELELGFGGIATSSGMAAVNTIYMTVLSQGDHVVMSASVYGPSRSLLEQHYSKFGIEVSCVETSDLNQIVQAIRPNTKMLFIETPSNPTMFITDLAECCKLAHAKGIPVVVDNTFSSPYIQRPIEYGVDIVFQSMTKLINGHADVVAGIIVAKEAEIYQKLRSMMIVTGCNMDPHQAYLVMRGLKTLSVRLDRAQANAMKIARFLENHPMISWVRYPGLESHPQHELARKQMNGFGSMISFELIGGLENGKRLMNNMKLALLAVSLGGVESLIQHPASMTHSKVPREAKLAANITDGLVRYSVGIEDADDLIADLDQALQNV